MSFLSGFALYAFSFLVVLTAIVFVHEWGHYILARLNGVRVETFSVGFGGELLGWNDRRGTRWKIGFIPFGGYVKFFGDAGMASNPAREPANLDPALQAVSFHHQRLWRRASIVFAGPAINFIFGALVFAVIFATAGEPYTPPMVGGVVPGSAAAVAGFAPGDQVLSIGDHTIDRFEDIRAIVMIEAGTRLDVVVRRDGALRHLEVTPKRVSIADGFGGQEQVGQLGITASAAMEFIRRAPLTALWDGIGQTVSVTTESLTYLGRMMIGRESGAQLSGPIRIAKIAGDVARMSGIGLISLMATLSISIGLVNLFPIPMLDGGHLLFYALEALRGRPLGERTQEMGFRFGLIVVMSLFFFATWNDLVNLRVVSYLTRLVS